MNRTLIVTVSITAVAVAVAAGVYVGKYRNGGNASMGNLSDDGTEAPAAAPIASGRELAIYTGDEGYVLKGKLLDEKSRDLYNRLPDTLCTLSFGDELYNAGFANGQLPTTSPEGAVAVDPPSTYGITPDKASPKELDEKKKHVEKKFDHLIEYLKLAEAGKADFATVASGRSGLGYMMGESAFDDEYGDNFREFYTREIPYDVKQELLIFFKSSEGSDYGFITRDQRTHSQLIQTGSFTGKDKRELACVLGTKDQYAGSYRERLLVFAVNGMGKVYLLHNEQFYNKILMELVYHDPEERWDDAVYMNSEEKIKVPFEAIRIKLPDQADVVLVYNEKFDKMNRYLQLPKSKLAAEAEESAE